MSIKANIYVFELRWGLAGKEFAGPKEMSA